MVGNEHRKNLRRSEGGLKLAKRGWKHRYPITWIVLRKKLRVPVEEMS